MMDNGVSENNPLAAGFLILFMGTKIILYKPSPGMDIFSMFTVWQGLFSLVLMFPGLRIEALP